MDFFNGPSISIYKGIADINPEPIVSNCGFMIQYKGAANKTPGEQMGLAIVKLWMVSKNILHGPNCLLYKICQQLMCRKCLNCLPHCFYSFQSFPVKQYPWMNILMEVAIYKEEKWWLSSLFKIIKVTFVELLIGSKN